MLGLFAIGFTALMIFTLVKNALIGVQLSGHEELTDNIEIIIPITPNSDFYLTQWISNLENHPDVMKHVKIRLLIDGHHPSLNAWQEVGAKLNHLEIQSFASSPIERESIPWMIEQVADKVNSKVVIFGDADLVPNAKLFNSLLKSVLNKNKPFFIIPQTSKINRFGEAVACLGPTIAMTSLLSFRKIKRHISYPLVGISYGWIAMPLEIFKDIDWQKINIYSWKEALVKKLNLENKSFVLAFGEKSLMRFYPENWKSLRNHLMNFWEINWLKGDRLGIWLYLLVLFVWSFPIFYLFTHPFWSLASIFLLILYRLFTKIIFQESWTAIILHPFSSLMWLGTFLWWGISKTKKSYDLKKRA